MPGQRAGSANRMKGDYPMNFFKNVYCSTPYIAKDIERYGN